MPRDHMTDAAEDRVLVGAGCELRQVLADLNAGNIRVDRIELAAKLGGRIRLQIERIDMRRTSAKIDDDGRLALRRLRIVRVQPAQRIAQRQANAANFQKSATSQIPIRIRSHVKAPYDCLISYTVKPAFVVRLREL